MEHEEGGEAREGKAEGGGRGRTDKHSEEKETGVSGQVRVKVRAFVEKVLVGV